MIRLKSKEDIIQIKKAIEIGESVLDEIGRCICPESNLLDLDVLIGKFIHEQNAVPSFFGYKGFPGNACLSVNEEVIHGVPTNRELKNGDILKIDIGINYNGYFSDQARTFIVGEVRDYRHYELLNTCKEALTIASWICKEGNNLTDVSKIIHEIAQRDGFGLLQGFGGHGVGFDVHEEPFIPNYPPYTDLILKKGMVLALEPMFVIGSGKSKIAENGWTVISDGVSAHEEKTIIIQ